MNNIRILDCTLRDGGYINNWEFGEKSIKKVITQLAESNIDIIECGFIEDTRLDVNRSIFPSVESIKPFIQPKKNNVMYVGMIAVPYIDIDKICHYDGQSIDGIRVTFHEDEIEMALEYSQKLMNKGYKVFIQPVGTTSYTDKKLLELIERVNEIRPYAFYLVDTLGIMYKNDLLRMFHLLDNNLEESITIGFHSHNNLQLSFSNAQEILSVHTKREIIIDSSVFGMGRGAGNLCTELITHFINENIELKYDVIPLLEIFDEHLSKINGNSNWGYTIPYYLAATNICHPNYASYLLNKETLSVSAISKILAHIPMGQRDLYDKNLIEELYLSFQENKVEDDLIFEELRTVLTNSQDILILGPGSTLTTEKDNVTKYIQDHQPFIISINFVPKDYDVDGIFFSNAKKFATFEEEIIQLSSEKVIIKTSNIHADIKGSKTVDYAKLLVQDALILDNAGLMILNLMKKLNIQEISLAGFDGYNPQANNENYVDSFQRAQVDCRGLEKKNTLMVKNLSLLRNYMTLNFITSTRYL